MKRVILAGLLVLCAVGTAAAVCIDDPNSYINSNNGALLANDSSYKLRALRAWVMNTTCQSQGHNQWSCSGDLCSKIGSPTNYFSAKDCFDLPSCSAWNCRQCTLKSNLPQFNNQQILRYQQGYGIAKWMNNAGSQTFYTAKIDNSLPSYIKSGD